MMQMANISVTNVNIVPSESLDKRVRETIAEWNFDDDPESSQKREVQIVTAVQLGCMFYGHTDIDIQCLIALYSYLLMLADDLDVAIQALEEFATRLCAGMPQFHPVLTALNEILAPTTTFPTLLSPSSFPPSSSSMLVLLSGPRQTWSSTRTLSCSRSTRGPEAVLGKRMPSLFGTNSDSQISPPTFRSSREFLYLIHLQSSHCLHRDMILLLSYIKCVFSPAVQSITLTRT